MLYHLFKCNMQNLIYIVSEKNPKMQKVYLICSGVLIIAEYGLIFPYDLLTLHIEVCTGVCVCVCVCVQCVSRSFMSDSLRPHGLYSPPSSSVQEFSRQEYWSGLACHPLRDLPNPKIKPRSLTLQADSLPAEPSEKLKNTGVGSLSFLQRLFPTLELNWAFLHCRWILCQLSYKGNPKC